MYVRLPNERIGVAIGPNGEVKRELERCTDTKLNLDSETGQVSIKSVGENPLGVLKARDILKAIARGFSHERAFRLLDDDQLIEIIRIRDFIGDSEKALIRIKGRIIGERGRTRQILERMTDAYVSVYGKTIAIIGTAEQLAVTREALEMLLGGAKHSTVYRLLEKKRKEMRRKLVSLR